MATDPDSLWVFGYGSLVWRPAFRHRRRVPARIRGFRRRFWQGSTDHRGVPGAPGRVVTLVEEDRAECWGMAYEVSPEDAGSVLASLDHREKGGYDRLRVPLHFDADTPSRPGLVYLANADNPNYLGPAPLEEIARQVLRSEGPSGHNVEYVVRLAEALRELYPGLAATSEEALALAEVVESLRDEAG